MPVEHFFHWMTFVVTEAFNPYREWLGLDTDARFLNHYQLLDLPEFEENTAKIHSAAERALVGVRSHRPGAQAAAWAKLLDDLADAKNCLTDPARKSAYDASLRGGARQPSGTRDASREKGPARDGALIEDEEQPGSPEVALVNQSPDLFPPGMAPSTRARPAQAKPTRVPPQTPSPSGGGADKTPVDASGQPKPAVAATAAPVPKPKRPPPPLPPAAPATAPAAAQHTDPATASPSGAGTMPAPVPPAPMNAHVAPPRRQQQSLLPFVIGIAAVLIVATLIIMLLAMREEDNSSSAVTPTPALPSPSGHVAGSSHASPFARSSDNPRPSIPAGAPTPPSLDQSVPDAAQKPLADTALHPPPAPNDIPQPAAAPSPPDIAAPPPAATTADPTPPILLTADPTSTTSPPQSAPATNPPTTSHTELVRLGQTLTAARQALAEHHFETAKKDLTQAESLAVLPEHKAMVQRLRRLAECGERFWKVVGNVVDAFRGTEELTVGSEGLIVIVVETGPSSITIRNQGRNTRYAFADMPPGLALAIAKQQLDGGDPEDLVLLGACLATAADPKPIYRDEARKYWMLAQTAGAEVDDLLLTLSDSYDLAQ